MEIHNWCYAPQGDDKYIGEFSIYFPQIDWWVHKCKVRRNKKGGLYINFKCYMIKDPTGKDQFFPISHPGEKRKQEFQRACLDAVKPFVDYQGQQ